MRPVRRELTERARRWGIKESSVEELSPLLQCAQCPKALDFPRLALPAQFRYGSPWRNAAPDVEPLARDERPLVFCSLGTLQGARVGLFARMAEACAAVGARAVIAHGGGLSPEQAAALPGDPLVRAFWPQTAVLRQCAAAVLHGGFNSVIDALAAAVPIVAMPIAFEQPATAARLAWTGAGLVVPARRSSARALTQALRAVLEDPGYRTAAGRIAAEMRTDGAAKAAADVSQAFRHA
jgi:MGT family glycosyltransferase